MRLHLRMANIRSELEILENPDMRVIFAEMRRSGVDGHLNDESSSDSTFVVTQTVTVDEQLRRLEQLRSVLADVKQPVRMRPSLQQCLDACLPNSHIYLPPGKHAIKFSDHIVGNGTLSALNKPDASMAVDGDHDVEMTSAPEAVSETVISSVEDDCWLLTFEGNAMVEGITFDCRKVRMGIQIRRGSVLFLNCTFLGDKSSNTKTGLIVNSKYFHEHELFQTIFQTYLFRSKRPPVAEQMRRPRLRHRNRVLSRQSTLVAGDESSALWHCH